MPHLAGRGRGPAALLMAAGSVSFVAGLTLLIATLAPMFGFGAETATVTSPIMDQIASTLDGRIGQAAPGTGAVDTTLGSGVIIDGPVNGVAFEMRIPSLGYKATVLEGVGKAILDRAPGHYPDSGWPGHAGNVGVAAHNVYWLSFARLKVGDRVEIKTRIGLFVYEITATKVVSPDDHTVLTQTPEHRLTLTTCYPLWAGAYATKRLVFYAREIGGVA